MHAALRQPPRRLRPALAGLLVLALLFGQLLGTLHSVTHGAAHSAAHAHQPACDDAHADGSAHPHAPALTALFDHAPGEPACRLFDQLLQAGPLMPAPAVLAPPACSQAAPLPSLGVRLAALAAAYQARGPPRA